MGDRASAWQSPHERAKDVRRRVGILACLALIAVSGVQCVQDLLQPHPPAAKYSFNVTPDSAVVDVGDTVAPFTVSLTADGKTVSFQVALTVVDGQSVVRAESAGRVAVVGRGVATLQVRPLSPALPVDTLAATVKLWAVAPRIGLGTPATQDTLSSFMDSLTLKAAALTHHGDTIRPAPIVWRQVSGAAAVALLDSAKGLVRAVANGVAEFEASVDTAHARRTVRVEQVPRSLVNTLDTVRFSAIGQTRQDSATVRDARAFAVTSATAGWQSKNPAVVTVCCRGALTSTGEGATIVIASFASPAGTVADTTRVIVQRMRLRSLSGNNQAGTVAAALAAPLTVELVDSLGTAMHDSGVAVVFKATAGGAHFGSLDSVVVSTDAQGHAQAVPALGTVVGPNTFTVYGPGLAGSPVAFAATAGPAAARTMAADSGAGQSGTVAQTLPQAFVVVVRDTFGNVVPGVGVTFRVVAGGGNIGGRDSLVIGTNAQGRSRTVLTLGRVAATDTVEGRAAVPVGSPVVFTAVAVPAAAQRVKFATQPGSIVAGASFAPALQVAVRDSFGNLVTDLFRQVTLTLASGTGASGATLSGTPSVGTAAGIAAFGADLTLGRAGTGYRLIASAPGLAPDTSAAFDVTPGAPDHLVFLVPPGLGVAGRTIRPAVQVAIRDANGNTVTTANLEVTLEVYRTPAGGSAALFGTPTVTAVNGVATFDDVGIALSGSGYKLRAKAASGQLTLVSDLFDVRGAPASIAKVSGDNQNGATGALLDSSLVVAVKDAAGNGVPGDTVVFKVTAGGGTLSGGDSLLVVTGANGQAGARLTLGSAAATNTVAARSVSLAVQSVTFTATALSGVLHLAFATQPATVTLGAAFSPVVRVEVRDELENVITTAPVTVTLALAGGNPAAALTGTTSVATVNGVATFTGLGVSRSGAGFTLTATAGTLASATSSAFAVVSVPSSIVKTSGDNQNGVVGASLGESFIVRVLDAASDPVAGDSVIFKVTSGAANFAGLDSSIAVTDAYGRALVGLTLGTTPGTVTVSARSKRLAGQSVTFTASATVAGRQLEFVVQPTSLTAGSAFSSALQVRVKDSYRNTDTSAATIVTLAITAGTGASGARLLGTTSVAAAHGVAVFAGVTIDLVGTGYTLTATATGLDAGTSSAFAVTFGAARLLRVSAAPTQVTAGEPFGVAVQVLDSLGNLVTSSSGSAVTLAISSGAGTTGAHLRGVLTVNSDGSGAATFNGLSIDSAGTGYTLTASSPGLSSHTSAAITVAPAPAVRLAFSVQPTAVTAGVAMSPAVVVLVQDSLGNTQTASTAAVSLALGTNPPGDALLTGTTSVAAVSGVATFANLRVRKNSLGYTLVASGSGLTSTTSATFGVYAAPPSKLVFVVQPANATPGAAISPAVQVAVQDSVGNTVPSATPAVTLGITTGTGTAGAVLAGTTTVNAVDGVATFSSVSIATQGNNYTLTATASGLTSAVSAAFSILPAAASRLVFTASPSSATAGAPFGTTVQVAVQDGSGTTVTTATNAITVAITSGSGTAGAHLRGTTTVSAASGIASFAGLSVDSAGSGYTLTATSSGLANGTSASITVLPAPPVRLQWRTQPTSRTAGNVFSPAVQVDLRDSLGNLATTTAVSVAMAISAGTGPAGAVLAGTTPVTSVNGVATFADLSIAKAGTGYTLTASASGMPSIMSFTFSITAGQVAAIAVSPAGASISGAGTTQAFSAVAKDSLGNAISGTTFTWSSLNPNVATVNGSTGVVTAVGAGQVTIAAASGSATGYGLVTVVIPGATPVNLWAPMTSATSENLYGVWGTSDSEVFAVGYAGTVLRYNGASWTALSSGTGSWLAGVWGTSGSEVYALGPSAVILRYNGASWSTSGTFLDGFWGLWGASGSTIFAVGNGGTILRYNGTGWSAMTSGTSQMLRGVWGTSASDVYAVGLAGAILHYNGANWSAMASGTSEQLLGVWGASQADIYAVGLAGTILHYSGASWSAMTSGTGRLLYGVSGTSGSDVYAVGELGTILRYDGTRWSAMSGTSQTLFGVWSAPNSDVYAVGGYGTILRGVRGATVTVTPASPTLTSLGATQQLTATAKDAAGNAVSGVSFTWASGDTTKVKVDSTGKVTAVANGSATIAATAPGGASASTTVTVNQIARTIAVSPAGASITGGTTTFTAAAKDSLGNAIAGETFAWSSLNPNVATINSTTGVATAVGSGQVTISASADGVTAYALLTVAIPGATPVNLWTPMTSGTSQHLYGVWGTSGSDVYAVGNLGAILRYDGANWSALASGTSIMLLGVWGTSGAEIYAVGPGTILRYNGTSWSAMESGTGEALVAVWGTSGSDVYGVGGTGTILHYNGAGWSTIASGTSEQLFGVWGTSQADIYAVGLAGTILHYNGASWGRMESGTGNALYGVWGTSGWDIYAVGLAGTILHYNGSSWSPMASGTGNVLYGVWGTSGSGIYAVGQRGTILRYNGTSWSALASGTSQDLVDLWGTSAGDVRAVGLYGTILRGVRGATVVVTPASPTLTAIGATQQLAATARDASNNVVGSGVAYTWTSSNTGVASVDTSGKVTAVANGSATITATAPGGASDSTTVTVRQVAKTIDVTPSDPVMTGAATTQTLAAVVRDSLNVVIPGAAVTWTSLNPNVATIGSANGLLTAVGVGQAVVLVTSGPATGSAVVNVSVPGLAAVNLWVSMPSGITQTIRGVWGPSGSDVFAVSEGGRILHYDGTAWSAMTSPTNEVLYDVWGSSSTDVYAVGRGGVFHYTGSAWSAVTGGPAGWIEAVWGSSPSSVFLGNDVGVISRYNGSASLALNPPPMFAIPRMWGTSGANLYAGGAALLHYHNTKVDTAYAGAVNALWGTAPDKIFGVGNSGLIIHYNGTSWATVGGGPGGQLLGVSGSSGGDVYVVGMDDAVVHRYDGSAWSASPSFGPGYLSAVWVAPSTDVFAAATNGLIVRGVRGATVVVTPASPTLTAIGATQQLAATARDASNNVVGSGVAYTWTSSNTGVASVDTSGKVTAVANGSATITATAPGGAAGNATVTVDVFATVTAGGYHTCGVTNSGAAYCWGYSSSGQLGNGSTAIDSTPSRVSDARTYSAIAAGYLHTCGVTSSPGATYCWGNNSHGELGNNSTVASSVPVTGGYVFASVSAGEQHSCGVMFNGDAWCWGNGGAGRLGNNDLSAYTDSTPQLVLGGLKFSSVSAGSTHSCGVTTGGVAYCWGEGYDGELGNDSYTSSAVPVPVSGGLTFTMVSAGLGYTCGITTTSAAYCWGRNGGGQLGNGGSPTRSASPVSVSGGLTFASVSAGRLHACGVTAGGPAYCWGSGGAGSLGNNLRDDSYVPVAVFGGLTFRAVSAGYLFSCGLSTGGEAYCWGVNTYGQLGNGSTGSGTLAPVLVSSPRAATP